MTEQNHNLQVGIYHTTSHSVIVYVNQHGICIYRARVELLRVSNTDELSAEDLCSLPIYVGVKSLKSEEVG